MSKVKLVVFDFDGVMIDSPFYSCWQLFDKVLGCEKEDRILKKKFFEGDIDYKTWSKETTNLYIKYGLNERIFYETIKKHIKPMEGLEETLNELKKRKIKSAVISGSILNIFWFLERRYKIRVDHVSFASQFYFKNGKLQGGKFTNYDFEGKVEVLGRICEKEKISFKDCAVVGDSKNDLPIFKKVGLAIAFNPKSKEVEKSAHIVIKTKDLREILNYIQE